MTLLSCPCRHAAGLRYITGRHLPMHRVNAQLPLTLLMLLLFDMHAAGLRYINGLPLLPTNCIQTS